MKHDQYARDFLRPRAEVGTATRDADECSGSKIDFDGLAARPAIQARPSSAAGWLWAFLSVGTTFLIVALAVVVRETSSRQLVDSNEPFRSRSTPSTPSSSSSAPRLPAELQITERPPSSMPPAEERSSPRPPAPTVPPHVHLAENGKWQPDFGYDWVDPNSPNLDVQWIPGMRHPHLSNVVTSTVPGKLAPAPGYRFRSDADEEFGVVPIRTAPTEEEQSAAVAKILVALVAQEVLNNEPDPDAEIDEFALDELAREFARQVRHGAIRGALGDLFPAATTFALDAAANFIVLAADGRVSPTELFAATAHDAVTHRLRAVDPDLADAELIAEFLLRVARACESRQ